MKALIVGELNPYGADPRHALFPYPENSAGGRLCRKVMQLEMRDYLARYDRVNLCVEKWSTPCAKLRADEVKTENAQRVYVLLGSKVCAAFGVPFIPFSVYGGRYVVLPHPSGRCRLWNDYRSYERARNALRGLDLL